MDVLRDSLRARRGFSRVSIFVYMVHAGSIGVYDARGFHLVYVAREHVSSVDTRNWRNLKVCVSSVHITQSRDTSVARNCAVLLMGL